MDVTNTLDIKAIIRGLGVESEGKYSGDKFLMRCPFHNDSNPSFNIYPYNGQYFYKCFSCFPLNTEIITTTGVKLLGNIKIDDYVLTHKGRYKKVVGIKEQKYTKKMIDLKIAKIGKNIKTTFNHKFFAYKKDQVRYGRGVPKTKRKIIGELQEIKAENLEKGDWVILSKENLYNNITTIEIAINKYIKKYGKQPYIKNNSLKVSRDLVWLLGFYVAEGSYLRGSMFTLHEDEKFLVNEIIRISKKIFGITPKTYSYGYKGKSIQVLIPNVIIGRWFRDICGNHAENKVIPSFIKNNSKSILQDFLDGYYSGDGTKYKIYNKSKKTISTISINLAYQIKQLLMQLDFIPYTTYESGHIDKNGSLHKTAYRIGWNPNNKSLKNSVILEDKTLCRVLNTEIIESNLNVRDLSVEEDHSYTVYGVSVHNCGEKGHINSLFKKYKGKSFFNFFNLGNYIEENLYKNEVNSGYKKPDRLLTEVKVTGSLLPVQTNNQLLNYLNDRNIFENFIDYFGIKYVKKGFITFPVYDRFIIPIKNIDSTVISYEIRAYKKAKKKLLYPKQSKNKDILFNINNLDFDKPIYLTEGILDLCNLFTLGYRNISCFFNNDISDLQLKYLKRFKEINILMDNDDGGETLISKLDELLDDREFYIIKPEKEGDDPADLTLFETDKIIKNKTLSLDYFLKKYGLIYENEIENLEW